MKLFLIFLPLSFAFATPNSQMDRLTTAFEKIKGCYWMDEDLLDPLFRKYHGKPKQTPCKDSACRQARVKSVWTSSSVTGLHNSWVYFNQESKKPLKVAYIELVPHNQTPAYEFELVVDPESYKIKGDEIRGGFQGKVLSRDHVGLTDEELKKPENNEREIELNQSFRVVGDSKKGITILLGDEAGVFNYVLRPAKREDCVRDEDYLEHGPEKPTR